MGLLKFRIPSPPPDPRIADLRKSYVTGLDRTPSRLQVEVRKDLLLCQRGTTESGRLFAPWPIEGHGSPIVGTTTLCERVEPYSLPVELARGKLNDVRNQLADWKQMGLRVPFELEESISEATRSFFKAATSRTNPTVLEESQQSLTQISAASQSLIDLYVDQVVRNRMASGKLPTELAIGLGGDPGNAPWVPKVIPAFNTAWIKAEWKMIAPTEGKPRWEELDAQVHWAHRHKLTMHAGPIIDLRADALPDWAWLWEGDFDAVLGMAADIVRLAVSRYRGKIPAWTLIHRPGSAEILGMNEEDQVRLTARLVQVARQADPTAQFLVGLDRPWGEWMASSGFQLGPLHLADYLARAELGISGFMLEIAPGFSSPGGPIRDILDFSKLLDLYALLNHPLHITFAIPSSAAPDSLADPKVKVEADHWPSPPSESLQAEIASRWVALAVAKPFVKSVTWRQVDDGNPHLYPHAGLVRPDKSPKPLVDWLKTFRADLLR